MMSCIGASTREWVTFESQGQKIFGILHLPEKEKPVPAVIILHGFASHKIGTNRSYIQMADALAEVGIATLRFDFRGAGDSEGDISEMTLSGFVADARLAFEHISEDYRIDEKRIGLFGSSLGGAIAVLTASQLQKIKALVLWAPVASGKLWYLDWIAQNPDKAQQVPSSALAYYRGVKVNPHFQQEFASMDATTHLKNLEQVPLLHIHGENDTTLSLMHQKAYEAHRKNSPAPTRFMTIPEAEHMLGLSAHFPEVMQTVVKWYQTYL